MSEFMDNPGAGAEQAPTTPATQQAPSTEPQAIQQPTQQQADTFSWKSKLSPDYAGSPTMQKFSDDIAGFNEAVKSHLGLEQLLGHEKVPIPQGDDDVEGWQRFSKAMGIPERADEYGLPDSELPTELGPMNFDKEAFAQVMHQFKLTPNQAKGMWETYTNHMKDALGNVNKNREEHMIQVINQMRGEWGDAYDANVELGQMVINKFAADQDTQDFITTALAKDPRGIKFLAKVGNQFAESKIGDFSHKRFSLTPEQAQGEIDAIVGDPNHPYNNDKASGAERDRAINYVNSLYAVIDKFSG